MTHPVHYYKTMNWRAGTYNVVCQIEPMKHPDFDRKKESAEYWRQWRQPSQRRIFVTTWRQVTCKACLNIIKERKQQEIREFYEHMERVFNEEVSSGEEGDQEAGAEEADPGRPLEV